MRNGRERARVHPSAALILLLRATNIVLLSLSQQRKYLSRHLFWRPLVCTLSALANTPRYIMLIALLGAAINQG